jgi:hypothetical protein
VSLRTSPLCWGATGSGMAEGDEGGRCGTSRRVQWSVFLALHHCQMEHAQRTPSQPSRVAHGAVDQDGAGVPCCRLARLAGAASAE